ncbi:hypothetical protein [Methyloferula stellata]|uniref:hypothetical protein n=1 Tax=Methyloferula stellata TaxID=876270 RepID=UPI000368CAF9|nr:hypothetical protein [Methyloferula stellata]
MWRFLTVLIASLFVSQIAAAQDSTSLPKSPKTCIDADFKADPFDDKTLKYEKACLSELSSQVKRTGLSLVINLENGHKKIYKDNQKACDDNADKCITYRLASYQSQVHGFFIIEYHYEGFSSQFVDGRDGKTISFRGIPRFSPDQSTFVAIDEDVENLVICNITIGYIGKESHETACAYWPDEENWSFVKWIDNEHISLQASFNSGDAPMTQDVVVARIPGTTEWIWNRSVAKPAPNE